MNARTFLLAGVTLATLLLGAARSQILPDKYEPNVGPLGEPRKAARAEAEFWRKERLRLHRQAIRAAEIGKPDNLSRVLTSNESPLGVPAGRVDVELEDGERMTTGILTPQAESRIVTRLFRVHQMADQIMKNLVQIDRDFVAKSTKPDTRIPHDVRQAIVLARQLKLRAADERLPEDVWDAFRRFEAAWKPIALAIPQSPDLTSVGRAHAAAVQRLTDETATALQHPAVAAFDRLQTATTARTLAQVMKNVSDRLYANEAVDTELRSLGGAALLAARELIEPIERRAPLATIIKSYEAWERAWRELAQAVRESPRSPPEMAADWDRIGKLDRTLRTLLYVEPMPSETPELTAVVMGKLLNATEFLACELREERGSSEAILRADSLALAVQDLRRSWLERPAPAYIRDRDFARVLYDWNRLREALVQVDYAQAQDSHQAAEAIGALVEKIRLRYYVLHGVRSS